VFLSSGCTVKLRPYPQLETCLNQPTNQPVNQPTNQPTIIITLTPCYISNTVLGHGPHALEARLVSVLAAFHGPHAGVRLFLHGRGGLRCRRPFLRHFTREAAGEVENANGIDEEDGFTAVYKSRKSCC